ncbi:MAG TPA: hypothetical protein VMS60_15295 [Solirubrobacterales bacterium]|nr:hypothetical protein [Solirubrobacterales bacterium]
MKMVYADKTMRPREEHYLSARFYLLMAAMGALIGVTMSLLSAPFWSFYVVPPIAMAAPLIRELRSLDPRESAKRDS